ncbi:gamma-glutamyltransferase family protein [Microbacterium sp. TNHR37B]|uniref:gamma-glutamyltransferase family protein n=1 Tax=Microbacterium sp. TNHR37B TaxID=1775956 RepID=UPI0007B2AB09|nr:gamma-glutamyltransferase [Microbacterium sp. TNHR37B]KZE91266.1 putative gamma-glutamyltransferase YwrD [Microbacterium sp. TNHR37B]
MTYTPPPAVTTRPLLQGSFGFSASTHWLATGAAQSVLERGGNAFDAAVAGGFVLHVVEPHLNGPGGDLVGLFTEAGTGATRVLMGQGPAPAGATIAHFRAEGLGLVPGAGGLAAAVPGAVDAWLLLLRDHGTWELADVLAPAIAYARDGHPLLRSAAETIGRVRELFQHHWPTSAALWLSRGHPPEPGEIVRNAAYADVMDHLASAAGREGGATPRADRIDAARRAWRELLGHAVDLVSHPHRHSTGTDHAGVLRQDDIDAFRAGYERPVSATFRGATVVKAGSWTQGPALLQALKILEPFPDHALDPGTPDGAHHIVEALKLALADRDAYFGDGADVTALLEDSYVAQRRDLIGDRASRQWRPGSPAGLTPFRPPLTRTAARPLPGAGEPTVDASGATRGDTCHIDVVDRWGNIVSVTPSGGWLQSSPAVPELGFCLGTRLQMCWLDESSPSALRPGNRPRTTLTPTLVLSGDGSIMAMGTPGGDQQEQWQLPMLLRMLVGGYQAQEAIDAPTLHTSALVDSFWPREWEPAGVTIEDRLGAEVIHGLRARGHDVTVVDGWTLGRLSAVGHASRRSEETPRLWAAANPRGQAGYAAGR